MYPYSLRPTLIFTSIIGFIWAIAMAVTSFRYMTSDAGEYFSEFYRPGFYRDATRLNRVLQRRRR